MGPGVGIPLMVFAAVVIIVALVSLVRIHDRETDVHQAIHHREMEHREAMMRLQAELREARLRIPRQGG